MAGSRLLPALLAVCAALALTAGPSSPGAALRASATGYCDALVRGDVETAHGFLSDSLGGLVSPEALSLAMPPASSGSAAVSRHEARGWPVSLPLEGGGSRTVWMCRAGSGWRVCGDTWLDGLIGSASVLCRDYALSVVLPSVMRGAPADSFHCPFSGGSYSVDPATGMLVCPAGHLGAGIDAAGDACSLRREEAAREVVLWMDRGNPLPGSFQDLWEASGGELGMPGGYRCPDDGYSFYRITASGVSCPYHGELTSFDGR